MNRVAWDLRQTSKNPVKVGGTNNNCWNRGFMATPGTYTVALSKRMNGVTTPLSSPQTFEVVPLRAGALPSKSMDEITAFRQELETLQQDVGATTYTLDHSINKVKAMQTALARSSADSEDLYKQLRQASQDLDALKIAMYGSPSKDEIGERNNPTVRSRMFLGYRALNTTYGPTATHKQSVAVAKKQLVGIKKQLAAISEGAIPKLETALRAVGAPWIEGQGLLKN